MSCFWVNHCMFLFLKSTVWLVCVFCSVGGGARLVNLTGIFYLLTRQSHQRLTVKEKIRSTNGDTWCTPGMLSAMKKNTQPCLCQIYTGLPNERVNIVDTHSQKFKWFFYYHLVPSDTRCSWKNWMKKMNKARNLLGIVKLTITEKEIQLIKTERQCMPQCENNTGCRTQHNVAQHGTA